MKTATLIIEDVKGYAGPANCYRLSEPLFQAYHVIVWAQPSFGMQLPEVVVVPSTSSGRARNMDRMPGSCMLHHEADLNDAAALALMLAGGYEIVYPEEPSAVAEPDQFERSMRVYEVAYKLDVPSARVIEALEALGVEGKTPNSNVEPVDAVRVRDYLNEVTDG
ncbi:UNVERIFIED_ORG: hypothetical protein M2328_005809 [Rhodococcus erythropolis]